VGGADSAYTVGWGLRRCHAGRRSTAACISPSGEVQRGTTMRAVRLYGCKKALNAFAVTLAGQINNI
jgi:hypothetical protein